jgi:thiol-disulfide isomerase/thioredoxin
MIELTMFELINCPYCIRARSYLDELLTEEPYKAISVNFIDEAKNRALAAQYDYYLVPTFYKGQTKLLEGRMSKDDVKRVLDQALTMT